MIEWNKVIYADCMNEENWLPTLEDKSIDLCLTDPPWDLNLKKMNYKDDYGFEWHKLWFNEILRICRGLVLIPGWKHFYEWIQYKTPNYLPKFWYRPNTVSMIKLEPLLFYGKIRRYSYMRYIFEINYKNNLTKFIHSSPKYLPFIYYILEKLKPESVIDNFLGSGTTAEACTKLGIPWLGYELNEVYSQDINKRLKNCKVEPKQNSILAFY